MMDEENPRYKLKRHTQEPKMDLSKIILPNPVSEDVIPPAPDLTPDVLGKQMDEHIKRMQEESAIQSAIKAPAIKRLPSREGLDLKSKEILSFMKNNSV